MENPENPGQNVHLKFLREEHGISPLILESLTKTPQEARSAVKFFKRMAFFVSVIFLTISLSIFGLGFAKIRQHDILWGIVSLLCGVLLIIYACLVFIRQARAIRAMEHFITYQRKL